MYTISADPAHNLVHVRLAGMMTVAEVDSYIGELKRTFVLRGLKPPYRMVLDVTACLIQSQDMIRAMGQHMATMPKASAIAVVTGSSLAKMQVRRLFTQPYCRIVADEAAGMAWAMDGVEPPSS